MKIVFMGTPAFAAFFLESLLKTPHEIACVVTQPDRPAGRGRVLTPPPVKEVALAAGIPVLQPDDLKSEEFENALREYQADLFVVVAYSILPKKILTLSRFGALNVHGSLLPKYRGAAPVQRAIANGELQTGVTVFLLDEKMDHGPVLERRIVPIDIQDTTATLLEKMQAPGFEALLSAINALENGTQKFLEQEHTEATPAPKLKKEEGKIDFNLSALEIHNRIRAFSPWPGGYASLQGKTIYFRKTSVSEKSMNLKPGEAKIEKDSLYIGTSNGVLEILSLQVEGKREMLVADFLRGLQMREGLQFC